MKEEISKEDQDWLDALSGNNVEGIDPLVASQAAAVRVGLQARRAAIEADATVQDSAGLDKLRERLRRDGLLKAENGQQKNGSWLGRLLGGLGITTGGALSIPALGMAAVLVLGVVVVLQVALPGRDDDMVYRGDPNVTRQIVENPDQRAEEFAVQLKLIAATFEVNRLSYGRVEVKVKDTQAVRALLESERLEPKQVDGYFKIEFVPKKN